MNLFDKNRENSLCDKYSKLSNLHNKVQLICKYKDAQLNQKQLHRETKAISSLDQIYDELSSFFLDSDFSGEENIVLPTDCDYKDLINKLDTYIEALSISKFNLRNPCLIMDIEDDEDPILSKGKKLVYLSYDYIINHAYDIEYKLKLEMKKLQLQQKALKEKDFKLSELYRLSPFTSNTKANTSLKRGCATSENRFKLSVSNLLTNNEETTAPFKLNNDKENIIKDYFMLNSLSKRTKEDDYIRNLNNLSLNRLEFNISSSLFNK